MYLFIDKRHFRSKKMAEKILLRLKETKKFIF